MKHVQGKISDMSKVLFGDVLVDKHGMAIESCVLINSGYAFKTYDDDVHFKKWNPIEEIWEEVVVSKEELKAVAELLT